MGLLSKAYKRLKYLSRGKSAYNAVSTEASFSGPEPLAAEASDLATSADVAAACTALRGLERVAENGSCPPAEYWTSGCFACESVVNVTELGSSCELGGDRLAPSAATADVQMLSSARGLEAAGSRNRSSESDSGVCLSEDELDSECGCAGDEDFEDEYECDCEDCAFARCEYVLEDWLISAKEVTLDKVLSGQPGETVYRYATTM